MKLELADLIALPNIGKVLAEKLYRAGITGHDDLIELGSVEVYFKIWDHEDMIGYNMLYAIEGAIQGIRWHDLPAETRQQLKAELAAAMETRH